MCRSVQRQVPRRSPGVLEPTRGSTNVGRSRFRLRENLVRSSDGYASSPLIGSRHRYSRRHLQIVPIGSQCQLSVRRAGAVCSQDHWVRRGPARSDRVIASGLRRGTAYATSGVYLRGMRGPRQVWAESTHRTGSSACARAAEPVLTPGAASVGSPKLV